MELLFITIKSYLPLQEMGSLGHRKHTWTDNSLKLYVDVGRNEFGSQSLKSINSKFNRSTPVFTKDGKTIYFTRNNYLDGKRKEKTEMTAP
jgi:hypothetical protein